MPARRSVFRRRQDEGALHDLRASIPAGAGIFPGCHVPELRARAPHFGNPGEPRDGAAAFAFTRLGPGHLGTHLPAAGPGAVSLLPDSLDAPLLLRLLSPP